MIIYCYNSTFLCTYFTRLQLNKYLRIQYFEIIIHEKRGKEAHV